MPLLTSDDADDDRGAEQKIAVTLPRFDIDVRGSEFKIDVPFPYHPPRQSCLPHVMTQVRSAPTKCSIADTT